MTKKSDYETAVADAQKKFDDWALFSWMWFSFAPEFPTYPGKYDGSVWKDLTSMGGWGDYSYQKLAATGATYQFGVYGSSTDTAAKMGLDTNPTACVERTAIVMINANTAAVTVAEGTINLSVKDLAATAASYVAPTNAVEAGSVKMAVALASAAAVATLF